MRNSLDDFKRMQFFEIDELRKNKQKMSDKTVKKPLSIPEWLNTMAVENNINFSDVLQKALKKKSGLAQ